MLGGLAVDGGAHGGAGRQVIGLAENGHAHAAGAGDAAAVGLPMASQGGQEGGLAGAVGAQDADAGAVLEPQGDVLQEQARTDGQAQVLHTEQVRHQPTTRAPATGASARRTSVTRPEAISARETR